MVRLSQLNVFLIFVSRLNTDIAGSCYTAWDKTGKKKEKKESQKPSKQTQITNNSEPKNKQTNKKTPTQIKTF